MVAWNPHIFIFGWCEDFLMGISSFEIDFTLNKFTILQAIDAVSCSLFQDSYFCPSVFISACFCGVVGNWFIGPVSPGSDPFWWYFLAY